MSSIPLSVLDLVPITSGSNPSDALRNTIDLAQKAEEFGYKRYWFAEHHLNPGVAGTSPPVIIALVASATQRIRFGSGGVQLGHRTALAVVEEFGLLDAVHPGRLDLGLGRSGGRNYVPARDTPAKEEQSAEPSASRVRGSNGLYIPERPTLDRMRNSQRVALNASLLQQPGAESPDYGEQVREIISLLDGSYRSSKGETVSVVPGRGADVQVWILGSSAGQSATVAGELGLPFAANYHVSPATVLAATSGYRAAFKASPALARPYVIVSADVVVAEDDDTAHELAAGYGRWVLSIRSGSGAVEFPTKEEASSYQWSEADRALVADRVETQFVGSPKTVTRHLQQLQEATDADELLITTITHEHRNRVHSYELLAETWASW